MPTSDYLLLWSYDTPNVAKRKVTTAGHVVASIRGPITGPSPRGNEDMMLRSATQAVRGTACLLGAAQTHDAIRPVSFLTEGLSAAAWYANASEQPKPVGSTP